jgi:hypothetical protein
MKRARFSVWSVLGLLLVLFLWITSTIVRIGNANPIVYIGWQKAENSWSNADYLKAVGETLRASWMTIDCGLRITMSQPFFDSPPSW